MQKHTTGKTCSIADGLTATTVSKTKAPRTHRVTGRPSNSILPDTVRLELRLFLRLREWLMRAKCSPLVLDATFQNRYITVQYHDAIEFAHAPHVEVGVSVFHWAIWHRSVVAWANWFVRTPALSRVATGMTGIPRWVGPIGISFLATYPGKAWQPSC